jgi:SAM-dependent methyltransferase
MSRDPWLVRWLPLLRERAVTEPVLELGCGRGADTAVLADAGLRVIAIDRSAEAIAEARKRVPVAEFHCQDIRAPFPPAAADLGAVVASLSLHYFPWAETLTLAGRLRTVLRPGGVLLARLNSTGDHNHGASGHPQIDERYYLVDGHPKRFFDHDDVTALFATGWRALGIEELIIQRYSLPKVVWEVVLERSGA